MRSELVSKLLDGPQLDAYRKLRALVKETWESTEKTGNAPALDQRISVSITKARTGFVPRIHVDREDSVAYRRAREILKDYPFVKTRLGGGLAHAAYPQENAKLPKHATSGQLVPGAAVSHGRFPFGTLGCVVEIEKRNQKLLCVVSAGHVLNLTRSVSIGDDIYCPGKGSVPRINKDDVFGTLVNSIPLLPLNPEIRDDPSEDVTIDIDIALVEITDKSERRLPADTRVPHPRNPKNKTIRLTGAVPESELGDYLGGSVYLFGAASGLKKGELTDVNISEKILSLPNRKSYLYKDLLAVAPRNARAFSQPGDSGAPVYTRNGLLLGLLIGADKYVSYICIAERALAHYQARLI